MTKEEKEIERFYDENRNRCTECGYEFEEHDDRDELCYIGEKDSGDFAVSCESCKTKLSKLYFRQSYYQRAYRTPHSDDTLWRYMDLAKYISMLSTSSLFLARVNTFEDPLEGAKGLVENRHIWDKHYLSFFKNAVTTMPDGKKSALSDLEVETQAQNLLKQLQASGNLDRKTAYVCCWHKNSRESQAMWRLYSTVLSNAVAVKTTYKQLSRSIDINSRRDVEIGEVKYIDFNKEFAEVNGNLWRKDLSFKHESEVRMLYRDLSGQPVGVPIKVDLIELIEGVYISPEAPSWFKDTVNDINEKYGVSVSVSDSELNHQPFY
ncbi:hypothetical protein KI655_08940 [Vibrio sp. D404a]|uniref:hypothetical protein n=1 Tax=unclassified Vibrio TaxID=2614977 RepID=UPI002552B861|nr:MULTISPECIES: hypothetical protein [unclassified Vibrio]MDK9737426.1 hypothetical protein [Vibrio sp. D404a]MDK9797898.1 hypothetical protein [Vibrio sp. D449a]